MATVYRAFLKAPTPAVGIAERLWAAWLERKLRGSNVSWSPGDEARYDEERDGWRLARREEYDPEGRARGVRLWLYEPERSDGRRWVTMLRATDVGADGAILECSVTVPRAETVPSLAAPRLVRDLARELAVTLDDSGLGFDLLEAGTTDPLEVDRRWAAARRWLQVSVRGVGADEVVRLIDDPARDVPIVLVTAARGEDWRDARPRAGRLANALAGCAVVVFAAGPEAEQLAETLGPILRVSAWSGNVRIVPTGIDTSTAQFGDAELIPWSVLRAADDAPSLVGARVLPAVATRAVPPWMEATWSRLRTGRRPEPQQPIGERPPARGNDLPDT